MTKVGNKPDWALNGGSDGKESACNVEDLGLTPVLGRSPGGRERLPTPVFLPGESPGTEEPGRLQRVRHELAIKHSTAPRPVNFEEETFLATVELLVCTLLSQDIFNDNHLCFHFFSFCLFWPCCTACEIFVLQPRIKNPTRNAHWTAREFPIISFF